MLQLHVFGPYFGLPDASPFCIKALTLMKMSGLPFEVQKMSFSKAPKGKAPYLVDGGETIADSHFIMRHLQDKHQVDFSGGYDAARLATGLAVSRMLEEHLYFISMNVRWLNDENFWKGPYQFFAPAPAPLRPLIARVMRGKVRKTQHLQGLGRHSAAERLSLAKEDLTVIENLLGTSPYVLGETVSAADASAFAFVWSSECGFFKSEIGDFIRSRPILMNYLRRMRESYFPEYVKG